MTNRWSRTGHLAIVAAAVCTMAAAGQAGASGGSTQGLGVQTGGSIGGHSIGFARTPGFGAMGWDAFGRWRGLYNYSYSRRCGFGTYCGPVYVGAEMRIDPALFIDPALINAPPPPPTRAQRVADLLESRKYAEAARLLQSPPEEDPEVESPGPAPDARLLGVALLGQGKAREAAEAIEGAYFDNPELAATPLDGGEIAHGPMDLRRLVNSAVAAAQRDPSAQAWLLAAVLMQAEGRDLVAGKMLLRAVGLGLDPLVAEEMGAALGVAVGE